MNWSIRYAKETYAKPMVYDSLGKFGPSEESDASTYRKYDDEVQMTASELANQYEPLTGFIEDDFPNLNITNYKPRKMWNKILPSVLRECSPKFIEDMKNMGIHTPLHVWHINDGELPPSGALGMLHDGHHRLAVLLKHAPDTMVTVRRELMTGKQLNTKMKPAHWAGRYGEDEQ